MSAYEAFLDAKSQLGENSGFEPTFIPKSAFDFQVSLIEWAVRKGRAAKFADCGMGKTLMELAFAQNVLEKTNKPVLVLTPLAVSHQTVREGEKFGIECKVSRDGKLKKGIVVTNYERLHYFDPNDFGGAICDESGILKNFDGKIKAAITEFMRRLPYRLLGTATASPNDYPELGTSSEALGGMGYMDMLGKFFKNDQNSNHPNRLWSGNGQWRFRGHAERDFWRWVCSWARAIRKPSDLGFDDGKFILPKLITRNHVVDSTFIPDGYLFAQIARTRQEELKERRSTLTERCEMAASLVNSTGKPFLAWCNLNDEGYLMEKLMPDAVQVSGNESDEEKEEAFLAFVNGQTRGLISKTKIAGFGLNFQHCAHQTFFADHSFEQYYQGTRRSWRFGQKNDVTIDMISSSGQAKVLANHARKARNAEIMFSNLVALMGEELKITRKNPFTTQAEKPSWLN